MYDFKKRLHRELHGGRPQRQGDTKDRVNYKNSALLDTFENKQQAQFLRELRGERATVQQTKTYDLIFKRSWTWLAPQRRHLLLPREQQDGRPQR
jgi:hypothetical protein